MMVVNTVRADMEMSILSKISQRQEQRDWVRERNSRTQSQVDTFKYILHIQVYTNGLQYHRLAKHQTGRTCSTESF